jgi:hypothetical protein
VTIAVAVTVPVVVVIAGVFFANAFWSDTGMRNGQKLRYERMQRVMGKSKGVEFDTARFRRSLAV